MRDYSSLLQQLFGVKGIILLVLFLLFILSMQFRNPLPVGWDVYYHLRVVDLVVGSGNLLNFDPISAGGRFHNYVPGYYAFLSSLSLLTQEHPMILARVVSIIFAALMVLSFARLTGFGWWGFVATAAFAFQYESLDAFIAAGMPQSIAIFLMFVILKDSPFLWPFSFVIGITHPSTLVLLCIFELSKIITNRAATKRTALVSLGALPYLAWLLLVGMKLSPPTWGWPADAKYYMEKLDIRIALLSLLGIGAQPYTIWAILFYLLTQFSQYLPRRFMLPLDISLSLLAGKGFERITGDVKRLLITLLVLYLLLPKAYQLGKWAGPVISMFDVESDRWLKENVLGGVLAHKDLTTISVLYFAQRPTVLDGYSEGVLDANSRMDAVVEAFSSPSINASYDACKRYNCKYVLYNINEEKWFGANFTKFEPLPLLFSNKEVKIHDLTIYK